MSNTECILQDGRHITDALSSTEEHGNPPSVPQPLEAALQVAATPSPKRRSEDRSDSIVTRHLLEDFAATETLPVHSTSSTKLGNTMREQIASIADLPEAVVVRLFGDAGGATESSTDTKLLSVIQTAGNRALVNGF